jgi:hypothetical protein
MFKVNFEHYQLFSLISLIEKRIVSEGTRTLQCSGFEILFLAIFNHFSCWKVLKLGEQVLRLTGSSSTIQK